MAEQLYALQRDVDMIAAQVQNLTVALNKLDWIAQSLKRMEEELTCQGEQMSRMEKRFDEADKKFLLLYKICKHLNIPIS